MIKKQFLFLFIIVSSFVFSQQLSLGKVTKDELNQKYCPIDSTASAAILFKNGNTKFRYSMDGHWIIDYKIDYKIKIYNKEGLSYAIQSIPYYVGGFSNETVKILNACTYNLGENKKSIEKIKLKSDGEFIEKVNNNWNIKKITFPQVKEGSIIEFTVEKSSPYLSDLDPFYFQSEIPLMNVKYLLNFPGYFKINTLLNGFQKISYENVQENHIYKAKNIPPIKEESHVGNIENYTSILKLEIASIEYPGQEVKKIALSWNDVTKFIYKDDNFLGEIEKNNYYDYDFESNSNLLNDLDKINSVFNHVKSKIKWNNKLGVYPEDGVKRAYKNNVGNIAEINMILISMLKHLNFKAYPVILSEKSNGVPSFPSRKAFNYLIAAVEYQNEILLLDASEFNSWHNILPFRALNWVGRLIYENGESKEINLNPTVNSQNNIIMNYSLDNDGVIYGNFNCQYTIYNAFNYRVNNSILSNESKVNSIQNKYKSIKISNLKVINELKLDLPVEENYDFVDNKSVEIIGDKIYFSPMLFLALESNPFKKDKRDLPIEFPYPNVDKFMMKIKIPENYIVEYLPKSENLIFDNKNAFHKYLINYEASTNTINLMVHDLNQFLILNSDNYPAIKEYFKEKYSKQNDKIVLKRK